MLFDSSWEYQNELHYNSTYIDIVSTYFPEKAKHITKDQVESFCNRLRFNFFNSFSTSAAYKALYSYSKLISAENNPYEIYQLINNEEKKLPFESESENVKSQVVSIEQANVGIGRISDVVQSNSATAEEAFATSEELSAQATNMDTLVAKFQLRE